MENINKTIGQLLGITKFPFTLENKTKTGKIKYEEKFAHRVIK